MILRFEPIQITAAKALKYVPGTKNRIDVFDPHKLPNPIKSFPVECKGGVLDLTLSGLAVGPKGRLMTVCGSVGGLSLDPRTGKVGKPIPQVGDTDEVWYDPASNSYYFAHTSEGARELSTAQRGAVGIVNADTEEFVTDIPFEGAGVHSVAVNAKNGHIFVPVYGKGLFVVLRAGEVSTVTGKSQFANFGQDQSNNPLPGDENGSVERPSRRDRIAPVLLLLGGTGTADR